MPGEYVTLIANTESNTKIVYTSANYPNGDMKHFFCVQTICCSASPESVLHTVVCQKCGGPLERIEWRLSPWSISFKDSEWWSFFYFTEARVAWWLGLQPDDLILSLTETVPENSIYVEVVTEEVSI